MRHFLDETPVFPVPLRWMAAAVIVSVLMWATLIGMLAVAAKWVMQG